MVMRLLHGSIRKKLAVLILFSALPAFVLILIVGLQNRAKAIDSARHELVSSLRRAVESQERTTASTRLMMENLSRVPDVRRADVVVCTRIFTNVLRINQLRYDSLLLAGLDGVALASSKPLDKADHSQEKHFREALNSSAFTVGEFNVGVEPGKPTISFACPVIGEDGQVNGVLLASMLLSNYGRHFEGLHFPDGAFLGVCDQGGVRLFRTPETASAPVGQPILDAAFAAARAAEEGLTTVTGPDGIKRLVAFRQLRLAPGRQPYLYLFVSMPVAAMQASALDGLVRDLGVLLLMIVLTLGSGWYLGGRTMGRRLEELAGAATRLGGGDLSVRVPQAPEIAEVDALSKAFNGMAEALSQDIAQRVRTEEELRQARAQSEAANHAKSEFLANMSHEIRTPLNGVLGMLQLIRTTTSPSEVDLYTEMAMRAGHRLTSLLGDILDLSRIEAGRMPLVSKPFALADIVTAVEETFSPLNYSKSVSFAAKVWEGVPPFLSGDELRVRQILFNLVGNAMKFTAKGEVRLDISRLLPEPGGRERLLFVVSDTGIGIDDDTIGKICHPFTQGAADYTRAHQGAGLGLSIVQHLVRAMRGTLNIESEPGLGTSVFLTLPFGLAERAKSRPAAGTDAAQEPEGTMRLLLVEDEEISRMSARVALERMGHTVTTAKNGAEALDVLRGVEFDCVLMDVQMDVMDGVEATRRLRLGEAGPLNVKVPVIAMTAYAMSGDRERFLSTGLDGYISKPVDLENLRKTLQFVAEERKRG